MQKASAGIVNLVEYDKETYQAQLLWKRCGHMASLLVVCVMPIADAVNT